ncbi:hypothetical protein RJ639_034103 [Escallonia herrerae]|uniref:HMA domain-containing protein n=1 Tax=Escallonia herrerae TaxID=1293975 RepID=A0AA88WVZ8_9ASTE|nr:hypothetical protein RJ639_034103 [Escallonia herrerae]
MAKEEKKDKVLAVTTAVYKVNLHCPKCAHDIKRPLLRTQVALIIFVELKEVIKTTTIKAHMHWDQCERDDLQKKLLKHKGIHSAKTDTKAQIITIEGTIESEKLLTYIRKRVHKHAEIIAPKEEKKEEKKEKEVKVEVKSTGSRKIEEFKEEKKVEAKTEGRVPYFVHYVYAPQLFSDENPNACSVM